MSDRFGSHDALRPKADTPPPRCPPLATSRAVQNTVHTKIFTRSHLRTYNTAHAPAPTPSAPELEASAGDAAALTIREPKKRQGECLQLGDLFRLKRVYA